MYCYVLCVFMDVDICLCECFNGISTKCIMFFVKWESGFQPNEIERKKVSFTLYSSNPYEFPRGDECFRYSNVGHTSNQCPERRQQIVNLETNVEENGKPKDELYKDNDDIEKEEEWTYWDIGVSLVTQHLLYTQKKDEDTQRHNIFKTRCTINERVCDDYWQW